MLIPRYEPARVRRDMTPEQVEQAIAILSEAYGKPPYRGDTPNYLSWNRGREARPLAVIDLQFAGDHRVSLWAWPYPPQPLEEQKQAYELARVLRAYGIPVEIIRGDWSNFVKVEE